MIEPDDVPSPWSRISRTLAYENAWIQVFHDEVLRPDGKPGIYGVMHPRTHAVGVVALDRADRVLLVGQYRYTSIATPGRSRRAACRSATIARGRPTLARRGDRLPHRELA